MQRLLVVAILAGSGVALAQPSLTPPQLTYAPPPPQVQLPADEQSTLQIGYVSDGQMIGGGLASLFLSFGIGQAIEGRWSDTGWIFTLGEPVAFGVMLYGVLSGLTCDRACSGSDGAVLAVGAIGFFGLRIWEIVDAFVGPGRQNARLQAVQLKLGVQVPFYVRPYIVPTGDGGAVAGLSLRF